MVLRLLTLGKFLQCPRNGAKRMSRQGLCVTGTNGATGANGSTGTIGDNGDKGAIGDNGANGCFKLSMHGHFLH